MKINNEIMSKDVLAARNKVLSLCPKDGTPIELDLSDENHYNFLINERGGKTHLMNHFPRYLRKLENARNMANDKNYSAKPRHLTMLEKAAVGDDVTTTWSDLIQITECAAQLTDENNGIYQVASSGIISFVDGLQLLNATLTVANPDTGELIDQTTITQMFDQGCDTIITAYGQTNNIDNIEASLVVDYNTYDSAVPSHKVMMLPVVTAIAPSSPINVITPVHKVGVNNVGFMKVCLGRSGSDCDYEYTPQPESLPPIPTISVSGDVSFQYPIKDPKLDPSSLGIYFFVKRRAGGSAQLFQDSASAARYFSLVGSNKISWNFNPAVFEQSQTLWDQGNEIDLNLTVQISVNGGVKNGQFQVTSLLAVNESPSVKKIDVLKFFWGCLSADTRILMQGNTEKEIAVVAIGDMVRTNYNDVCFRVVDITTGNEEKPCLRIKTEENRSILVTDQHPICKLDGFCLAKELCIGDKIITVSGVETILTIENEKYDGIVYNLKLESEEDISPLDVSHYANGFVVGDANMQGYLLEKRQKEAMAPCKIADIPKEWQFDAINAERMRENKQLLMYGVDTAPTSNNL